MNTGTECSPRANASQGGITVLAHDNVRTTAQLGSYLDDIVFPCSRMELLRCAEDNEAPDLILDAIEALPERYYTNVRDILSSIEMAA